MIVRKSTRKRAWRIFRRNCLLARRGDTSNAGEYAHLRRLFSLLKIDEGYVGDVAASDGVTQSCILGFFSDPKWLGLAVEMDPDKFASLAFIYARFSGVRLARCKVTPNNVAALLQANEVPNDITLLNLDIDSYDLHVMNMLLQCEFRPKVISMEINEKKIPPPLYFTVDFDDAHHWRGDHFYGCSLAAAADVVKPHGYKLESLKFNNAIFVRDDVCNGLIVDRSVAEAYDSGYRNQPQRAALFSYNVNVECALTISQDENLQFFKELFEPYAGRFTLR